MIKIEENGLKPVSPGRAKFPQIVLAFWPKGASVRLSVR
jgi:hypothetical protein